MPKLKILSKDDIKKFDNPPIFTAQERFFFFRIDESTQLFMKGYTGFNKVRLLVMIGYFIKTGRFFSRKFKKEDLLCACSHFNVNYGDLEKDNYSLSTFHRHCNAVRNFFNFSSFSPEAEGHVRREIQGMVKANRRPSLIFEAIVDFLNTSKIEAPGYNALALIIISENKVQNESIEHVIKQLSKDNKILLENLFCAVVQDDKRSFKSSKYILTLLKRLNQSSRPTKIKESITDFILLKELYFKIEHVLKKLNVNDEGIKYYAHSVIKSDIAKYQRMPDTDRFLHIICFISFQYFQLQDNLIEIFLNSVSSAYNSAKIDHKNDLYDRSSERDKIVTNAITKIGSDKLVVTKVQNIINKRKINSDEKISLIKELLKITRLERSDEEKGLTNLKGTLKDPKENFSYYLKKRSLKLQNRASNIIKEIAFNEDTSTDTKLLKAILYFKEVDGKIDYSCPSEFLKPDEYKDVFQDGGAFEISLYKVYLFLHISNGIKSGSLNFKESFSFRSFDEYEIPKEKWSTSRDSLLKLSNLSKFKDFDSFINEISLSLDSKFKEVNERIISKENHFIKFNKKDEFILKTPAKEQESESKIHYFLPKNKFIPLYEVLLTVNNATGFLDKLHHWKTKHLKERPPQSTLVASLIGQGCGIGTSKMSKISKNLTYSELENTLRWFFSPDNVLAANSKIVKFIDALPLPSIYLSDPNGLHTSSDGQKWSVSSDSILAKGSFKYHGNSKGLVVNTHLDERHILFFSKLISSTDREAASVIDGLMHNDIIKSSIHSTDTHGYSDVIFGTMNLLGFKFAPRIKTLKKMKLYSFNKGKEYRKNGYKILPSASINMSIIRDNWDEILRFVATIKLKETTASQLFKRLNSYSKQHVLYKALKELGKIYKTLFILEYIDDVDFRQAIEKQLNKVESSNRFSKVVSFGNNQELAGGSIEQLEIAEGCRRLIKNSIICWNYLYFSQKIMEEKDPNAKKIIIETLQKGSIACWRHINMHGEYDFSDKANIEPLDAQISDLLKMNIPKIMTEIDGVNFSATY